MQDCPPWAYRMTLWGASMAEKLRGTKVWGGCWVREGRNLKDPRVSQPENF